MLTPIILLGFIISTIYGALFHFWRDDGVGHLVLYLLVSWVGFWLGHILASYFSITFDKVGDLHLGTATSGSFLFLVIGYWLSLAQNKRKEK